MNKLKKVSIAITLSLVPFFYANANDTSPQLQQLINKYENNNADSNVKPDPQKLNDEEQDVEKRKMELWKEYLRAKEETDAKKNGIIVSEKDPATVKQQTKDALQPDTSSVSNSDNNAQSEDKSSAPRFTCIIVSNIKGAQLNEKNNFDLVPDSIDKDVVFAIENSGRSVYVNDGMSYPFLRIKPNIIQRYIPFMEKNDVVETWVFDPKNKKAIFSQIKTGEDIGNSSKTMIGDISNMILSNDCNQVIQK